MDEEAPLRTPEDVYISFWRSEIARMRQSAKLFKHDPQRRRYIAACRKRFHQALRARGATYQEAPVCTS